ncbi:MAG TPA: carboxypeptidase regulatory-like domain-containing protein, partial [Acidimicrobiia bacterium]|nr:carboxypeptidase regulatory-like domain-containing protein [Acidimicrobiia bacterium]
PSLVPCDNVFHGTHTMGTMVGDDGDPGTNQIGVAPHARWIAAKGCEDFGCSDFALLSSGQWVIAPTDLAGQNPRPDLAPNIVNNSWGTDFGGDPFYQATVDAWNAAGIFPAFSNGNNGFGVCGTVGAPGSYVNSYGAGAFDIDNNIADFSSLGPSPFASELKPNLSAPGVNVRSSVPGGGYDSFSGTSMASPHVAATVALMWSAAPSLEGDIALTRQLLDDSAVDTEDLSCGGTADDNNVWGEGRLDAFAAVNQAPRIAGTLTGTVTDQSTGNPIQGASVRAVGPTDRTTFTGADGTYRIVLQVGSYDVTASHFGHLSETATGVVINQDQTTTQNFALTPAPSHSVSGHVRDDSSNPLAGATVTIQGTPIPPATTDASGAYSFASVPEGTYDVTAEAGGCYETQTQQLVVDGAETLDFTLPQRHDNFGYFCQATGFAFVDANTVLPLSGDDASLQVDLPFPFTFYGDTYTSAHVGTNGFLNFLAPDPTFFNSPIPSPSTPNGAVYAFWDDLFVDGAASVRTELLGAEPNRRFVIEWDNVTFFADFSKRVNFEVILTETGQITYQYQGIDDDGMEKGNSATIGIENAAGDDALQFSFNQPAVSNNTAILFTLPPSGFVQGTVTDANDGQPITGATIRALQGADVIRETTTDADGHYRTQLPLGTYTIEASATNYATETAEVVLDQENEVVTQDFALRTARAEVSPASLEFLVPQGQTRTKTLTLSNTGSLDMTWELKESGGGPAGVRAAQGRGQWLHRSTNGVLARTNTGGQAKAYPSAYRWRPTGAPSQASVLIYADDAYHTAPNTYLDQALQRLGMGYTAHYDADFAGFESDLTSGSWDLVLFGDDNFFPPTSTLTALNDYVNGGGKLVFATWTLSFNPSPLYQTLGFASVSDDFDPPDPVHFWQPDHPVFTNPESVPELTDLTGGRYGIYGQAGNALAGFDALAGYTTPGPDPNQAAMVLGNGSRTVFKGFMDGQNDADLDADGTRDGVELWANLIVGLEFGFFQDVPWLSEAPTSGTLAPGRSQAIDVTVDTTGLAPGVYGANLFVLSNSARQPQLRVPVTLIVPAYYQGVNAGGGDYTDRAGDLWAADRQYAAGSYGYTNPTSRTAMTRRAISGTDDDPLYQDQRVDPTEYRFDGLPAGVYQVDLRFAEVTTRMPGTRLFDVIVEGAIVLPAHDVAGEVGSFAADDHTFFLQVTDGQLNIRFVARRGYAPPIVNAVRAIHRPDR